MKASEIKEAASAYIENDVSWTDEPSRDTALNCRTDFKAGALWMQSHLRDRIKLAMGTLWDEDEIIGSLWLGSTAICLIKAALEMEPEVDAPIPFDGEENK
jgi:hypothetical protein